MRKIKIRILSLIKKYVASELVKLSGPIITYTYLTFDEYVKDYKCSYYNVPTNYEYGKNFNGKLIGLKECCKEYDDILKSFNSIDVKSYIKFNT